MNERTNVMAGPYRVVANQFDLLKCFRWRLYGFSWCLVPGAWCTAIAWRTKRRLIIWIWTMRCLLKSLRIQQSILSIIVYRCDNKSSLTFAKLATERLKFCFQLIFAFRHGDSTECYDRHPLITKLVFHWRRIQHSALSISENEHTACTHGTVVAIAVNSFFFQSISSITKYFGESDITIPRYFYRK